MLGRSEVGQGMSRHLLYSGYHCLHHDETSGYDNVVASIDDYVDGTMLLWGRSPHGTFRRKVNYLIIDLLTIVKAAKYPAVFMFYPEQTAFFAPALLKVFGKRVIFALHHGRDFWVDRQDSIMLKMRRINLRFVDKFIVLSRAQYEYYSMRFPERVSWVPHGVWCDRGPIDEKLFHVEKTISIIGDMYRDYDQIKYIVSLFRKRVPEVTFNLIGLDKKKLSYTSGMENVIIHSRLSHIEYKTTLQKSLFILLPLTFASANNALLEGMSYGVPVYCSNVEGVRDYVFADEYIYKDPNALIGITLERLKRLAVENIEERNKLKKYTEERFGWKKIREAIIAAAFE
jgi:glycosyltransferase involved in cell wall biosynthesis